MFVGIVCEYLVLVCVACWGILFKMFFLVVSVHQVVWLDSKRILWWNEPQPWILLWEVKAWRVWVVFVFNGSCCFVVVFGCCLLLLVALFVGCCVHQLSCSGCLPLRPNGPSCNIWLLTNSSCHVCSPVAAQRSLLIHFRSLCVIHHRFCF